MKLLSKLLINVIALLVVDYLLVGLQIRDLTTAFVAAVVIGLVNTFIRPVVQLIALPLTIMTFGIFALIINVLMLVLATNLVPGFHIDGFLTAVLASILLSLVSSFLNALVKE